MRIKIYENSREKNICRLCWIPIKKNIYTKLGNVYILIKCGSRVTDSFAKKN